MRSPRIALLVTLSAAACGIACAQNNGLLFNFPNGNVYTGVKPVVVEVWAKYDWPFYIAWAGWQGSVLGDDTTGDWTNLTLIHHSMGSGGGTFPVPGVLPGTPVGGSVLDIINGQLHFPPLYLANTANPIHIWSAEWSSTNLTKRQVVFTTDSEKFSVYGGDTPKLPWFGEAMSVIQVVPAPAGVLVLVSGVLATRRRRP